MEVVKEIKVRLKIEELLHDKVDEIKELKAEQSGEITPLQLVTVLMNELMEDDIEELAVVRKHKDDTVTAGWTTIDGLRAIGLAEYMRMSIADEIMNGS